MIDTGDASLGASPSSFFCRLSVSFFRRRLLQLQNTLRKTKTKALICYSKLMNIKSKALNIKTELMI